MSVQEKLVQTMYDESFCEVLLNAKNESEAKAAFVGKGFAESEFEELRTAQASSELSEDELGAVAGGVVGTTIAICSFMGASAVTIAKLLKCNQHTNWGRNGKKCICGMHPGL